MPTIAPPSGYFVALREAERNRNHKKKDVEEHKAVILTVRSSLHEILSSQIVQQTIRNLLEYAERERWGGSRGLIQINNLPENASDDDSTQVSISINGAEPVILPISRLQWRALWRTLSRMPHLLTSKGVSAPSIKFLEENEEHFLESPQFGSSQNGLMRRLLSLRRDQWLPLFLRLQQGQGDSLSEEEQSLLKMQGVVIEMELGITQQHLKQFAEPSPEFFKKIAKIENRYSNLPNLIHKVARNIGIAALITAVGILIAAIGGIAINYSLTVVMISMVFLGIVCLFVMVINSNCGSSICKVKHLNSGKQKQFNQQRVDLISGLKSWVSNLRETFSKTYGEDCLQEKPTLTALAEGRSSKLNIMDLTQDLKAIHAQLQEKNSLVADQFFSSQHGKAYLYTPLTVIGISLMSEKSIDAGASSPDPGDSKRGLGLSDGLTAGAQIVSFAASSESKEVKRRSSLSLQTSNVSGNSSSFSFGQDRHGEIKASLRTPLLADDNLEDDGSGLAL